jgi:protoporphyrinogen oxidase
MCRRRIEGMGNEVLLKHRVLAIETRQDRAVAVLADTPHGTERFRAHHVISSAPLRALVHALEPSAPADVTSAANGLKYRDFLTVALIVGRDKLFQDNWIYIHSPGVKVGRIQNFNNWSQALVPVPHKTCLGLEYFCFQGDRLWESRDDELLDLAKRELEHLGLASASDVEDGVVVRMPKAYPIYDSSYRDHLDTIRRFIDPISNLHTVGRNGMHKYNNQDHSMLTAMMTLWNMQGAAYDVWSVNTDFDYHEDQKVTDSPSLAVASA